MIVNTPIRATRVRILIEIGDRRFILTTLLRRR